MYREKAPLVSLLAAATDAKLIIKISCAFLFS